MAKTKSKEEKKQETICNIKENYARMEKGIVNQLFYSAPHSTTIGTYREKIWGEMFADIVPRKFVIEQSVFIIDSNGNVSNEVDLAIFDETYTPYIFKYGHLKFIPIEAVAVVVECKSTSMDKKKLTAWVTSIKELKTSRKSYTRINTKIVSGIDDFNNNTQTSTRPLRILCCLNEKNINDVLAENDKIFDIVIRANEDKKSLSVEWNKEKKNLYDWYASLNHADKEKKELQSEETNKIKGITLDHYLVKHCDKELSLMTFNFQLNQVLMLINNPIFFPHIAYAEMFNKNGIREEETHE